MLGLRQGLTFCLGLVLNSVDSPDWLELEVVILLEIIGIRGVSHDTWLASELLIVSWVVCSFCIIFSYEVLMSSKIYLKNSLG